MKFIGTVMCACGWKYADLPRAAIEAHDCGGVAHSLPTNPSERASFLLNLWESQYQPNGILLRRMAWECGLTKEQLAQQLSRARRKRGDDPVHMRSGRGGAVARELAATYRQRVRVDFRTPLPYDSRSV